MKTIDIMVLVMLFSFALFGLSMVTSRFERTAIVILVIMALGIFFAGFGVYAGVLQ